jgi:hypothetical protein
MRKDVHYVGLSIGVAVVNVGRDFMIPFSDGGVMYVFSSCFITYMRSTLRDASKYRLLCGNILLDENFPRFGCDLRSKMETQVRCRKSSRRKRRTASHLHLHEICRCRCYAAKTNLGRSCMRYVCHVDFGVGGCCQAHVSADRGS